MWLRTTLLRAPPLRAACRRPLHAAAWRRKDDDAGGNSAAQPLGKLGKGQASLQPARPGGTLSDLNIHESLSDMNTPSPPDAPAGILPKAPKSPVALKMPARKSRGFYFFAFLTLVASSVLVRQKKEYVGAWEADKARLEKEAADVEAEVARLEAAAATAPARVRADLPQILEATSGGGAGGDDPVVTRRAEIERAILNVALSGPGEEPAASVAAPAPLENETKQPSAEAPPPPPADASSEQAPPEKNPRRRKGAAF